MNESLCCFRIVSLLLITVNRQIMGRNSKDTNYINLSNKLNKVCENVITHNLKGCQSGIKHPRWRHERFPHFGPFVRGIHWSPVDSLHKGVAMFCFFFFMFVWTSCWTNDQTWGNLRFHRIIWHSCNGTKCLTSSHGNNLDFSLLRQILEILICVYRFG